MIYSIHTLRIKDEDPDKPKFDKNDVVLQKEVKQRTESEKEKEIEDNK
jgi:hypothetical protein